MSPSNTQSKPQKEQNNIADARKGWFHRFRAAFLVSFEWIASLKVEARLYGFGGLFFLIGLVTKPFGYEGTGVLMGFGAFVYACGFICPLDLLYQKVWKHVLGKVLIGGTIALATNYAYGLGRQAVAGIIGTSPSPFPGTVTTAVFFQAPILILFALSVMAIPVFLATISAPMLLGGSELLTGKKPTARGTAYGIARLLALCIICFGAWGLKERTDGYQRLSGKLVTWYLYNLEMYKDPAYASGEGERITLLPDGRVLVGNWDEKRKSYTFAKRQTGSESLSGTRDKPE